MIRKFLVIFALLPLLFSCPSGAGGDSDKEGPQKIASPVFVEDDSDYFLEKIIVHIDAKQELAPIFYKIGDGEKIPYESNGIVIDLSSRITAWAESDDYYSDKVSANFVKGDLPLGKAVKLESGVYKYSDIKYSEDECCTFNLYLPDKITYIEQAKPAVVYIHGGSWNSGSADDYENYFESGKYSHFESYVRTYGMPVVSMNYHLLGQSDNQMMAHAQYTVNPPIAGFDSGEEHVELGYNLYSDNGNRIIDIVSDVRAVFDYINQNAAALKIDNSFSILDGYSAGANIALLYCFSDVQKPIEIKALIDRVGPANIASAEYIKFFSGSLVHGTYNSKIPFLTSSIDVNIQMQSGDNDGERFLESMVKASTGLDMPFNDMKTAVEGDEAALPDAIKEISPVLCTPEDKSELPYIVMIYGSDCNMDISVKLNSGKPEPSANITGDFFAPRIDAERLALSLDTQSFIQKDSTTGRIVKNKGPGAAAFAYYKADFTQGQKVSFIGSANGGHGMSSSSSNGADSPWTSDELSAVKEAVSYALEIVCALPRV